MTKIRKIYNPISQGVQIRRILEHPLSSIRSNELGKSDNSKVVHDAVWGGLTSQAHHHCGGQLARALLTDVQILVYCISLRRPHPREELCVPLGEMCRSLHAHQQGSGLLLSGIFLSWDTPRERRIISLCPSETAARSYWNFQKDRVEFIHIKVKNYTCL